MATCLGCEGSGVDRLDHTRTCRICEDTARLAAVEPPTLAGLIASATVAYAIALHAEQNDGRILCRPCADHYVRPVRLTEDDMNRIVLALGPEMARCSRCQAVIQ